MGRSKIESALSETELQDFCNRLANTPELTLKKLQSMAAEVGIEVSLMGAKTFRDGAFSEHIEKMRRAKDLALQLREVGNADAAGSIADAGALVLMQQVYDSLTKGDEVDYDTFSKIIARLRSGDHRLREVNAKLRESELRIEKFEREKAEREAAKKAAQERISKKGGISPEAMEEIDELLKICKFIATKRPSYKLDLSIIAKEFSDYNIQLLETPELEISSTDIRQRIKKGYSIQYITTEQVQQYIRKEELYL